MKSHIAQGPQETASERETFKGSLPKYVLGTTSLEWFQGSSIGQKRVIELQGSQ